MWPEPNPILNEEERELLNSAPEECLRRAVGRGAISLDDVTHRLSARATAVVRSIATGERAMPYTNVRGLPAEGDRDEADVVRRDVERRSLSEHPQLLGLVDEQLLTVGEAYEVAHAIDHALGRYLTGTRYAAP